MYGRHNTQSSTPRAGHPRRRICLVSLTATSKCLWRVLARLTVCSVFEKQTCTASQARRLALASLHAHLLRHRRPAIPVAELARRDTGHDSQLIASYLPSSQDRCEKIRYQGVKVIFRVSVLMVKVCVFVGRSETADLRGGGGATWTGRRQYPFLVYPT